MLEAIAQRGPWTRIERRDGRGRLLDFVEVGACAACGVGVDRECPVEYRESNGRVRCIVCAQPTQLPLRALLRDRE